MNPNKKKELIKRVKNGYQRYRVDLLDYYTQGKKPDTISTTASPEEYYNGDTTSKPMMLKPNIYYYLNKEERRILKAIMGKKPGYENIKLGE